MDTLSHGLWATVLGKGVNLGSTKKIKIGLMALWGIIPDLFAFTPVVLWMLWQLFYKGVSFSDIPRPEIMPPEERNAIFILRLSETLYHISHSFVTFLVLFFLAGSVRWHKRKREKHREETSLKTVHPPQWRYTPCWEMTGWFIHVLMDIPTHSGMLYPTLFLWPLSDWYYDGNSWGTLWFMIANYSCLLIVFMLLRFVRKVKST